MEFGVEGLGFMMSRMWGSGYRVEGLGSKVHDVECGFGVQGLGFRVFQARPEHRRGKVEWQALCKPTVMNEPPALRRPMIWIRIYGLDSRV